MEILIAYASKTGTTEKCAEILGEKLKDVTIINLERQNENISKYDLIIIGSPIRVGMIHKKVKQFILKNLEILKTKKVAYFICCGFSENMKQYYEQNIPKELLEKAIIYDNFGGEMEIDKQKGFDKFIAKMVSKNMDENKKIEIKNENIDSFIKKVQEIL